MKAFKIPLKLFDFGPGFFATKKGEYISNGYFVVHGGFVANKREILEYVKRKKKITKVVKVEDVVRTLNIDHTKEFQEFDILNFYMKFEGSDRQFLLGRQKNTDSAGRYLRKDDEPKQHKFENRPVHMVNTQYLKLFDLAGEDRIYSVEGCRGVFEYPSNSNGLPDLFVLGCSLSSLFSRDLRLNFTDYFGQENSVNFLHLYKAIKRA